MKITTICRYQDLTDAHKTLLTHAKHDDWAAVVPIELFYKHNLNFLKAEEFVNVKFVETAKTDEVVIYVGVK